MEKYLETNCSDINFTVVRPPGLTNGPASGMRLSWFTASVLFADYIIVDIVGRPIREELDAYFIKGTSNVSRMPRADVAQYMLDCLPKSETYKKAVAIGL